MKAVLWTRYGSPDGLQFREVEKPSPGENEILVKVHASTVTAGDCGMRTLKLPLMLGFPLRLYNGLFRPKRITILGQELAGEIEAVGPGVTRYKEGDRVFGTPGFRMGAYAQYTCLPAESENVTLAVMPAGLSYEEAAPIAVGGIESWHYLRQADIQPGEKVLIVGAGGSIGTFGIQLASYLGAEVTGVDSTGKLDMMRSLGAAHVIDYTQEDFTRKGETYDVVFDVAGKSVFSRSLGVLKENGRYLLANPRISDMIRGRLASREAGKKVILGTPVPKTEDLLFLAGLVESGTIKTVIDRRYPLEQAAEAHQYVETGQKRGNVVITVA